MVGIRFASHVRTRPWGSVLRAVALGSEATTQLLRGQAALAEDLGSVPSPDMVAHNHA